MVKRPLRSALESATSSIPEGPVGLAGNGNVVGGVNFLVVSIANTLVPLSDVRVGYNIESHTTERRSGETIHIFEINSANRDVAKFAAKINTAPSNVDAILGDVSVVSTNMIEERATFSTWEVETSFTEPNTGE